MSLRGVDASLTETVNIGRNDTMPSATNKTPALPSASPFLLKVKDVDSLANSDGFSILREHLAEHYTYE